MMKVCSEGSGKAVVAELTKMLGCLVSLLSWLGAEMGSYHSPALTNKNSTNTNFASERLDQRTHFSASRGR